MKKVLFVFAIVSIFTVLGYALNSNIVTETATNQADLSDIMINPADSIIKTPCGKTVSTKSCTNKRKACCGKKIANTF